MASDIVEVKAPLFLRHLRVKHHLEQQIAQRVAQIVKVGAVDCVDHFIGFFEGIRRDSGKGLLVILGTALFRIAQGFHDAQQAIERSHNDIHVKWAGDACVAPT